MNDFRDDQIDDADCSARVRELNDRFRQTLTGGTVVMTAGVVALGADTQARFLAAVQTFEAFTPDNDPWNEHDFGAVEVEGYRVFFKIDYFDLTRALLAEDPADPAKTERVMTIMLADEY
jgi:hypothetical protein